MSIRVYWVLGSMLVSQCFFTTTRSTFEGSCFRALGSESEFVVAYAFCPAAG